MQDTEQNRWILLDMARAMGGYGYDEMWWADVFEPDELEYSAPDLYEKFVNSSDYALPLIQGVPEIPLENGPYPAMTRLKKVLTE